MVALLQCAAADVTECTTDQCENAAVESKAGDVYCG